MSQFFWVSKKARAEDPSVVGLGQLAFPLLMENLLRCTVGLVNVTFLSHISDSIVSAISVANQYIMVVQVLAMSISMGTITCLNQAIGMKNRAKMNTLTSIAFFSILLILFRQPLLRTFTENEAIIQIGMAIILIDFVVEIGRALNNSLSGALQAAGDVRYQLIVNQLSGWLVSVGGSYVLGILFGLNLYGVWIAFALDELTRGLILLRRWRSDHWVMDAERRRSILARGNE